MFRKPNEIGWSILNCSNNMKLCSFQCTLGLVLFGIFVFFCSLQLIELLEKKTAIHEEVVNAQEILYPSITICKKYTFEDKTTGKRIPVVEKKKLALQNVWNRSNVFYFVSHYGMMNITFPCITNTVGSDPAKLCSFPFFRKNVIHNKFITDETTDEPFCWTKSYSESRDYGDWGNCLKICNGEKANPTSPYNLANYKSLWEENFYDLRSWGAGYCHTYNPPNKSVTSYKKRVVMLLGKRTITQL